jgi:hypothetical protein
MSVSKINRSAVNNFKLTELQAVQVNVAKSKKTHIDMVQIQGHLRNLKWPLHFLDYETIPYAIPRYNKSFSYQQLPFQFSLHVKRTPGAEVEHFDFLHRVDSDPRRAFAESLLEHIDGDGGSIIVYHAGFERSVTDALKEVAPEFSDAFDELISRLWDLETPFSKRWYCDPKFGGSSSIKFVLPVLVPALSYKTLEIQKGDVAQKRYGEMIKHADEGEKGRIAEALLQYCKLDTLAMVEILKVLQALASRENGI